MGHIQKLFICSFVLTFGVVSDLFCTETTLPECLHDIGGNNNLFLTPLKQLINNSELDQKLIDKNTEKYWRWVSDFVNSKCIYNSDTVISYDNTTSPLAHLGTTLGFVASGKTRPASEIIDNLNEIADQDHLLIPFELNGKKYDISIDVSRLFDYIKFPTAVLVAKDTSKKPGSTITKSSIPRGQHFFSSECSTHNPSWNIPNDAPVNAVGQSAFGSEYEYFLDQPVGLNYRSFPGLVIKQYGTSGGYEQVMAFANYKEGRTAMKKFAVGLQNTPCRNQGLAVYHVKWPRSFPPKQGNYYWIDFFVPPDLEDDIDELMILSDPEAIH